MLGQERASKTDFSTNVLLPGDVQRKESGRTIQFPPFNIKNFRPSPPPTKEVPIYVPVQLLSWGWLPGF